MRWMIFLTLACGLASCQSSSPLGELPCPCTNGYVCCEAVNLCLQPAGFCPNLKVAKYVKAFTADNGMKVFLLDVDPPDLNQALLKVTGSNHIWDEKVFLHQVRPAYTGFNYFRLVDGLEYTELYVRQNDNDETVWTLNLKGIQENFSLHYSDSLSAATKPQDILLEYVHQGGNPDPGPAAREKIQADELAALTADMAQTNQKCGSTITANIDWSTFANVDLTHETHSVSGYCGAALTGMRNLCDSDSGKIRVQTRLKKFECDWSRGFGLNEDKFNFGIYWEQVNAAGNVEKFLDNNL